MEENNTQAVAAPTTKNSPGSVAIGWVCMIFSSLIIIPGIPQALGAILSISSSSDPSKATGYLTGSVLVLLLGGWLFKFGYQKAFGKQKAG